MGEREQAKRTEIKRMRWSAMDASLSRVLSGKAAVASIDTKLAKTDAELAIVRRSQLNEERSPKADDITATINAMTTMNNTIQNESVGYSVEEKAGFQTILDEALA